MRKTIFLFALIIAASLSISGQAAGKQSSKTTQTEQELITLTREFADAVVKRNVAALERLLADDYIDILPDGTTASKSQIIANNKKPVSADAGKLEAIDLSNSKVRLYGDAALVTLRITFRGRTGTGQAFANAYITTVAAVKKNRQWRIALIQSTAIQPSKPTTNPSN